MRKFFAVLNSVAVWSAKRVELFGAPYGTFAIFGLLNYPFSFIVLYYFQSQEQESFAFRMIASIFCVPLLLHRHWPHSIRRYLPLYWHATLLYCIPFFAMVMMCRNNFSLEWMLNMLLGIFLFILLVDWFTFLVLLLLGSLMGFLFFNLTGGSLDLVFYDSSLGASASLIAYLYVYAVVIGVLFARSRERIYEAKIQTVKSLAFSIAHEMRTPLASIAAGASNLKNFLPIYVDAYGKAQDANLPVASIAKHQHAYVEEIPQVMEKVSNNAQNIINMLLMKVRDVDITDLEKLSISAVVQSSLDQFPLRNEERAKIKLELENDFEFECKEEMILHVFFNLLKNSLYQISQVENGHIKIWTECLAKQNILHFKDNGKGIPKQLFANIFDRFVTGTDLGTGMGLAYCKMVMNSIGGDIKCYSEEDRGAEFKLIFPKPGKGSAKGSGRLFTFRHAIRSFYS